MSSEITGKLLAGRLFIKVTEFPMFELTLSPVFDCNESNSENVTFELFELEAALHDGKTKEHRLRGVGTESCERWMFCDNCRWTWGGRWKAYFISVIISRQRNNWFKKCNIKCVFLSTNNFFISSDILVLTHALTAEAVTGSPAMVETEFTEIKCSEEIVNEKEEGEDE